MSGSAILTNNGLLKIASASPLDQLTITQIAIGDGVNPLDPNSTALVNEVYRDAASTPIRSTTYPNTLVFELNIPPTTGGFTCREIGAFDTDGDLIAVGTLDELVKPTDGINYVARINVKLANAAQVDVFYDNQGAIDHGGLRNRNAVGAHDDIYIRTVTLSKAISEDAPVGTRYIITDLYRARYDVVEGETVNNLDIKEYGSTKQLKYIREGYIDVRHIGDSKEAFERCFDLGGAIHAHGDFTIDNLSVVGKDFHLYAIAANITFTGNQDHDFLIENCSGSINGGTYTSPPSDSGFSLAGIFRKGCNNFNVNKVKLVDGKEFPMMTLDSDNCNTSDSVGIGNDTSDKPFAWELVGCKDSKFINCNLYKYNFGFVIIGSGYKSGIPEFMTTRDIKESLGMKIINSFIEDHQGHPFDINGAFGAEISGCIAKDYTGTTGQSSLQIKQSTNIPEEGARDTFVNTIRDSISINGIDGFKCQDGVDATFINNKVYNCKRYPFVSNKTDRVVLHGFEAYNWGTDITSWPLQNGDTKCAAVTIWPNSDFSDVSDVKCVIESDYTNTTSLDDLAIFANHSFGVSVDDFTVRKRIAGNMGAGLINTGNNLVIGSKFRLFHQDYVDFVDDPSLTTSYPLHSSVTVDSTSVGRTILTPLISRGMIPVKALVYSSATSQCTFTLGERADLDKILDATSPNAIDEQESFECKNEFVSPEEPLFVDVISASSLGNLTVSVFGLHLL